MTSHANFKTVVVDAGARYGMHPSWSSFRGDLQYVAFEPDPQEARRLSQATKTLKDFRVVKLALDRKSQMRDFHLYAHRGYSSFLKPILNSEWFGNFRPNEEARLEKTIRIKTTTLDHYAKKGKLSVDFLKIDVEGADLDVLTGGDEQLRNHVLGVRAGVYFQPCYQRQCSFSQMHDFLTKRGFFLLNMDYFGKGVPKNSLFRTPDPFGVDFMRYGVLVSTDAVWLKSYRLVVKRYKNNSTALAAHTLKYAYFCMLNHAPDVAVEVLQNYSRSNPSGFDAKCKSSKLYLSLRKACAEYLGRWRVYPDEIWFEAQKLFLSIFGLELPGGSQYWEMIQSL